MKSFKQTNWYQILFEPKKGQLLTVIAWLFIIGAIYGLITLFTGCKKNNDAPVNKCYFKASMAQNGLKTDYIIDHAQAVIDVDTFVMDVFYDEGDPYTASIQLSEGNHTLKHFVIYDSLNNEIGATPLAGSTYDYLVNFDTLPKQFTVNYAAVTEVPVTVLYMTPEDADLSNFGYAYFGISPAYIHTINFYGQKGTYDSLVYHYENTATCNYRPPYQEIMSLVYWVAVNHKVDDGNWTLLKNFYSEDGVNWSEGSNGHLYNVSYIDYDNHIDSTELRFQFEVWWPQLNSMATVNYGSSCTCWSIILVDDEEILSGDDGLTTIALGPDSTWFPDVNYFFHYNW